MKNTAARNATIARTADEILEIVLSLIAKGLRKDSSKSEMELVRDLVSEQCGIGKLRATEEVRAAMIRRATASTNPTTRAMGARMAS